MKRIGLILVGLLLAATNAQAATSLTWAWNRPTANADGSVIPSTAVVTYGFYAGAKGAEVLIANGLASPTYVQNSLTPGATVCAYVTDTVNAQTSPHSLEVCGTVAFPVPQAPTGLTVK